MISKLRYAAFQLMPYYACEKMMVTVPYIIGQQEGEATKEADTEEEDGEADNEEGVDEIEEGVDGGEA
jgi:hypothetical protein